MLKNTRSPLSFTPSKRNRILVGLSWDARADDIGFIGRIQGDTQHDLDLSAFVYDDEGDFIDLVSADANDAIDDSGAIYHSGDDQTGEGDGDDEHISVELAGIPENIQSIIFIAEAVSDHAFGEIAEITMRLADGMTDKNQLQVNANDEEGRDAIGYIFARIYRERGSDGPWMVHFIGDYPDTEEMESWGDYLKRYL